MASPLDFLWTPVVGIGLVSMLLSLIISVATRLLTSKQQQEAWRKEIARLQSEINKLKSARDRRSLEKMQRLQSQILSIQSKVSMQSLKVLPVSLVTYIFVWWLILAPNYSQRGPVAFLPWFWEKPLQLGLFEWYFLCSILFGTLFNRVLGLGAGGD